MLKKKYTTRNKDNKTIIVLQSQMEITKKNNKLNINYKTMCTKICDYNYTLSNAATLLDEQFTYVNVLQMTFIYNHHQHVSFLDILEELGLLFYIIQKTTEDERIVKVTIVYNSKMTIRDLTSKIKRILKKHNTGRYKVYIVI